MAALREVVSPARFTLLERALSAALAGPLDRLVVELPQALPVEGAVELPPQLLPEELREELNEEEELPDDELKEERPPPPLDPRAQLSLAGKARARESRNANRSGRVLVITAKSKKD